jgi:hypothetical protein
MNQPFKFFGYNKLLFKKADLSSPTDSSVSAPHPYGVSPAHTVNENFMTPGGKLKGTSGWNRTVSDPITDHFGDKITPEDFLNGYHIPGMQHQKLSIKPYVHPNIEYDQEPDYNKLHINYKGSLHPNGAADGSQNTFNIETIHQPDENGDHSVHWEGMYNKTGNNALLGRFLANIAPMYQKAGIKSITTDAFGNDTDTARHYGQKMNGQHTWANLGFDFGNDGARENTRHNAYDLINNSSLHPNVKQELLENAKNATHPFHFQDIARRISPGSPYGHNAKQNFNMMLSNFGESNPDKGYFPGKLNIDPKDAGYQRLQGFLKRFGVH